MTKTAFSAPGFAAFAAAALAFSGSAAAQPDTANQQLTKGEQKLAKLIGDRVAGEPKSCIPGFPVRSFQVIDETAIVYKIGRTVWINRTRDPQSLDDRDTLVFRRFGSNICSSDIVTSIDAASGFYTGNVFLGEFVPYRMADSDG